jgi:hypothetical protein
MQFILYLFVGTYLVLVPVVSSGENCRQITFCVIDTLVFIIILVLLYCNAANRILSICCHINGPRLQTENTECVVQPGDDSIPLKDRVREF